MKEKPTLYIDGFGHETWRLFNGKLHREDGPAMETQHPHKHWYRNGKLHRTDGPAREYHTCGKEWWVYNRLHRLDGPARENIGGVEGNNEWWIRGKQYTYEDWVRKICKKGLITEEEAFLELV